MRISWQRKVSILVAVSASVVAMMTGCDNSLKKISGAPHNALAQWDRAVVTIPSELPLIRAAIIQSPLREHKVGIDFANAEIADRRYDLSYYQERGLIITDVLVRSVQALPYCSPSGPPREMAEICRDLGHEELAFVRKRLSDNSLLQATIILPNTSTISSFGRNDIGVVAQVVTAVVQSR